MLYAESHVTPLTRIYRRRALSVPGLVQCRYGDQVTSDRVIASADVPRGYHLLDLEDSLNTRIKHLDKVLTKKIGDTVTQGEVIARLGRISKRESVSPVTGKILDARRGKVLLEALPDHIELMAFYPGKIANLIPERGAVIEVTGALIQGVWGIGRELRGRLECLVPNGETLLQADEITSAHMGIILVGGRTLDADILANAVENRVSAIVVGSVSSTLVPVIRASGVSVLATEGFGDLPVNRRTFELLQSHSGYESCFSPVVQTRWEVRRPEIIIPMPAEGDLPAATPGAQIKIGTRVRALRAPYEGRVGQVVALPPQPRRIESGIRARGAEVDLDTVGKVFVPFDNLEILR